MTALINFVKSRLDLLQLNDELRKESADGALQAKCADAMVRCIQSVTNVSVESSIELTRLVAETPYLNTT